MRLEDGRSDPFDVDVGVHQGSVLSSLSLSLSFAVVLDEITKDVTEGILYAYDLVLLGDSWSEAEKYSEWKKALNQKGLKINASKTKSCHTGPRTTSASKINPCAVCGKK